jgi:hypothetical protein
LGIVGAVLFWFPFLGAAICLVGLILGILGVRRAGRVGRGKGMAVTGIVLGAVFVLAGGAMSYAIVWAWNEPVDVEMHAEDDAPGGWIVIDAVGGAVHWDELEVSKGTCHMPSRGDVEEGDRFRCEAGRVEVRDDWTEDVLFEHTFPAAATNQAS